eukprot:8996950-Pyramimonas_sp.AAC.1
MDDGNTIAPFDVAPWVVRRLVMRGVQRRQWRQVSKDPGNGHLAAGGELEPLVRLATTGRVLHPEGLLGGGAGKVKVRPTQREMAHLRSLIVNGQWTQA